MYTVFSYIHKRASSPLKSIDDIYKSIDDLKGKVIAYNSFEYHVYNSVDIFEKEFALMTVREYHEVIFDQPQKLKFDIDANDEKLDGFIFDNTNDNSSDSSNSVNSANSVKYKNI